MSESVTLNVCGLTLKGYSVSGISTYIMVPELDVVFDMGDCPSEALNISHVMVTHMHGDHARCLSKHWELRAMLRQKPGTYYVPESAIHHIMDIAVLEHRMQCKEEEPDIDLRIMPDLLPEPLPHNRNLWGRSFRVDHRAPSVGYTVGRTVQKLKPEYAGLSGPEIGLLRRNGSQVSDTAHVPVVTFIGDCDGASLKRESHIWESKVVIIECTYVEDVDQTSAVKYTHTHLLEIADVLNGLDRNAVKVEAIVLKHFSQKTDPRRIRERVDEVIPPEWRDIVHIFLP